MPYPPIEMLKKKRYAISSLSFVIIKKSYKHEAQIELLAPTAAVFHETSTSTKFPFFLFINKLRTLTWDGING